MKIYKAILLTILLIVISYIPQLILLVVLEYTDLVTDGFLRHIYIVVVLSNLISFLIVFYYFWKPKPSISVSPSIKQLDLTILPYLLLIVIGLGLAEQPLLDFEKILDYYQNSEIKSHSNKFIGFSANFLYLRISSLIIAPIFEELFFRKFLFSKLLKKNKLWIAVVISSICFSAIHFETPNNLIPTFIYGVIACIIYFNTKNIIYLIIIHFLYNLSSMLYMIYGEPFFDWVYGLNYDLIYWALAIFGILITVLGVQKITTANIT